MLINRGIRFLIIGIIFSTFLPVSLVSISANASFQDSRYITEDGKTVSARDIDEIKVKRALENKLVAEKLMGHGLLEEQVLEKMEKMSDAEVHQIASLSDRIPSGGDGLGVVIGVLVVVALVLVILYLYKRV